MCIATRDNRTKTIDIYDLNFLATPSGKAERRFTIFKNKHKIQSTKKLVLIREQTVSVAKFVDKNLEIY